MSQFNLHFIEETLPFADAYDMNGEKSMQITQEEEKPRKITPSVALFNAYPNPSNGSVTLDFEGQAEVQKHIVIYGLDGKQVGEFQADQKQLILDLEGLFSGIYLIQVTYLNSNVQPQTQRLVISQ